MYWGVRLERQRDVAPYLERCGAFRILGLRQFVLKTLAIADIRSLGPLSISIALGSSSNR